MPCQPTGAGTGQGNGLDASGSYPRTVSISRYPALAGGDVGYRGMQKSVETAVTGLQKLPATIDFAYRGPDPVAKVPSDIVGRTLWRIYVPAQSVTVGAIHRDDIATDDVGRRFKLNEPRWGAIDIQIECELLRA